MRINFEHPVIVSGSWENGRPRHELVRTSSEFEIETYASSDVPVSMVFAGNETCRAIGERIFTRAPYREDRPSAPLEPSPLGIHNSLYTGGIDGFDPIWKLIKDEETEIKQKNLGHRVENIERVLLPKEQRQGHTRRSVACVRAPVLKNWKWLSAETDAEVDTWKTKIAELLSAVVLVDGVPYVRTAEPRLELQKSSGANTALVFTRTKPLYTRLAYRTEYEPGSGLSKMGEDAFTIGSQFFGLGEIDKLQSLASDLGWNIYNDLDDVEVRDTTALSVDHLEMETIRHARLAVERASAMALIHAGEAGRRNVRHHPAFDTISASIEATKQSILGWQGGHSAVDAVSAPFAQLVKEIASFPIGENEYRRPGEFNFLSQFEAFETRIDAEPVFVSPLSPRV